MKLNVLLILNCLNDLRQFNDLKKFKLEGVNQMHIFFQHTIEEYMCIIICRVLNRNELDKRNQK